MKKQPKPSWVIGDLEYTWDKEAEREEKEIELDNLLNKLLPREKEVIDMRFGIYGKSHTLEEIGKHFDITSERVRQIEAKALIKLRHPGWNDSDYTLEELLQN